ncbi:hypothetical protein Plo01_47840 [Planobispora longispora]|uniref:Uncharacterized protein n=1 Tax=Planobispora longispora TaxID=28887 RepID=A0A8J3RPH8_9ACTN|nr:hypothetical protein Plo01_47840 [Planobispora longispora]
MAVGVILFVEVGPVEVGAVEGEQAEQVTQVRRLHEDLPLVPAEDDRQRGQVFPVVAPPQDVEGAGVGGPGEGDQPLLELRTPVLRSRLQVTEATREPPLERCAETVPSCGRRFADA